MDHKTDTRLKAPDSEFRRYGVSAGVVAVRRAPEPDAEMLTQALGGETVRVFAEQDGFAHVQMESDGYVGWADMDALSLPPVAMTHRVSALRTYVFSGPTIKSAPHFLLSRNALVTVGQSEGRLVQCDRMGWVAAAHLSPLEALSDDPAGVAETYLGAPYLWGGKESLGLDCSGLVQMAYAACGVTLPRDTDMQFALAGTPIEGWQERSQLMRGDLVFWKGHVGIMLDAFRMIHANAHHMCVAVESVQSAIERIGPMYGGPIGARRIETAALRGKRPSWLSDILG